MKTYLLAILTVLSFSSLGLAAPTFKIDAGVPSYVKNIYRCAYSSLVKNYSFAQAESFHKIIYLRLRTLDNNRVAIFIKVFYDVKRYGNGNRAFNLARSRKNMVSLFNFSLHGEILARLRLNALKCAEKTKDSLTINSLNYIEHYIALENSIRYSLN